MAVITQTIQPGERRNEVTEMQKALISLGANIAHGELATEKVAGTYGPSTQTAIIALLDRFGLSTLVRRKVICESVSAICE
jgi:peptidoglycan hydrolase-like protein with peptidoglycan-binding domain